MGLFLNTTSTLRRQILFLKIKSTHDLRGLIKCSEQLQHLDEYNSECDCVKSSKLVWIFMF